MIITDDIRKEIKEMLIQGMSQKKIAEHVGCSEFSVSKVKKTVPAYMLDKDGNASLRKWLRDNWHFTGNVTQQQITRTKDGLRIVHKGERGHLRTPYRTDGRFQ